MTEKAKSNTGLDPTALLGKIGVDKVLMFPGDPESVKYYETEHLYSGSDTANKLEELTTAHGHVIKDEEALKTLIRDLRSKTE